MRGLLVEGMGIAAGVAAWLVAGVGLVAASRHRRRSRAATHRAARLAALERHAVWDGPHVDPRDDDPHAQWLGAGGSV